VSNTSERVGAELLPCPFCGRRPSLKCISGTYTLDCDNPHCVWSGVFPSAGTVVEAWNRRFALKPEASQETKPPQTADEFRKRLLNDPIAYAYYNLGRAVERDIQLTPEQRKRKNWDAICAAVNQGYAEKILPDIWTAELEDAE
jgi:hypothetical protein